MNKKNFRKMVKDKSIQQWENKIRKLAALESKIQADIKEFSDLTGVKILDIQIYDPETGEIQFETDL